jgi:hypothetical protein
MRANANLEMLSLNGNNFSGFHPSWTADFSWPLLAQVRISNNSLSGAIRAFVADNLPGLIILDLSFNPNLAAADSGAQVCAPWIRVAYTDASSFTACSAGGNVCQHR